MRKFYFFFAILFSFSLMTGNIYAQKQTFPSKAKDNQTELIDTRVDNMRYWKKQAEKGLVPVAQEIEIPAAKYTGSEIIAKSVKGGKDDSPDIPVTDQPSTQSENSIFVDPTDTDFILNSNNSTSLSGNVYGANYFLSEDGGTEWGGTLQGAGGGNSGDPATAINLNGSRMYVNFIHSNGGQGTAYSTNGGGSWISVVCGTPPGGWDILDKNHMWIDNSPTSDHEGNLYVAWTAFGNSNASDIELVRSTDEGLDWSSHMNISSAVNAGSHNQGVNIQTGPNGEVYALWAIYDSWPQDETALGFAKSTDGGQTFAPATRIIENIRGIRNSGVGKNQRVNSFPVLACDISSGQYSGNLYAVWTNIGVPGTNSGSDADAYMIKSEDDGDTWSEPIRINQDPTGLGSKHYFPWITCDPETGGLSAIFYDDRNVGGNQCEVYCANSFDGGETWEDFKVSDVSFTPTPIPGLAGDYMGDYLGIVARGGVVYPVWTDTRNNMHMTYVSPYLTNNLASPSNLLAQLDDESGETDLYWQFEEPAGFLFFNVYRDGEVIGTTTDTTYTDMLPDYGVYLYSVTAQHDEGESPAAGTSVQWGDAQITVNPEFINTNLEVGSSTVETVLVENVGELELEYSVSPLLTSKKGSKDYCSASGGCDEYISQVIFGDIDNSSSCDGYADYTDQSTTVSTGTEYDITVVNGNVYSADDLGIWVDWNQDDDFEDAGENVVCEANNSGQGTFSILIPFDATPGTTTMRLRIKYSGDDCGSPCGTTSYGEVEDYSINVLGWLSIDNFGGTIAPGESAEINVTLDAADLDAGIYTAELEVGSNDPDNGMLTVPITLAVGEDIPTIAASADPVNICEGESTQLSVDVLGGSGSFTYEWTSDPEGFISTEQNPMASPEDTTTYMVKVFDGVFTVYDQTTVNIAPLPGLSATPTGETVFCQDPQNTTYATEGAENAMSYIWSIMPETAGTITGEGDIGIVDWNMEFSGEVMISVAGVNDCGDGESSESLTVTVHALPDVTFDMGIDSICIYTDPFDLTTGEPAGGVYSGTGVSMEENVYSFDPTEAGTGEHTITYSYIDENECENSADHLIYVGECLGISEVINGVFVEIFPNPSNGNFTVKLQSSKNEELELKVFNSLGSIVYSETDIQFTNSFSRTIDLKGNPEGLYFVKLSSGETNYVKKIIIRQ